MNDNFESIFSELESLVMQTGNKFWNIPSSTADFLQWLVYVHKPKNILEIGTSNGYSGLKFAQALSHTGGKLYTVESHAERFEQARLNFERAGVGGLVTQVKGHAPEVVETLDLIFDMVFLDATKMEYKSYVEALVPKMSSGALLIADNCVTHENDLSNFLQFMKTTPLFHSVLLRFDNGLLLASKV